MSNAVDRNDSDRVSGLFMQIIGDVVYEQTQEKFNLASIKGVVDLIGDG